MGCFFIRYGRPGNTGTSHDFALSHPHPSHPAVSGCPIFSVVPVCYPCSHPDFLSFPWHKQRSELTGISTTKGLNKILLLKCLAQCLPWSGSGLIQKACNSFSDSCQARCVRGLKVSVCVCVWPETLPTIVNTGPGAMTSSALTLPGTLSLFLRKIRIIIHATQMSVSVSTHQSALQVGTPYQYEPTGSTICWHETYWPSSNLQIKLCF